MRRKDVTFEQPVMVRQSVDCWQKLIHTLREAVSGKFIVTVHNGQVIKVARVDKEVKISEMPHPRDKIPGPKGVSADFAEIGCSFRECYNSYTRSIP